MHHSAIQKLACVLIIGLFPAPGSSAEALPSADSPAAAAARNTGPDSQQMEQKLQKLSWPQFRFVVESVPKLKADVEAYGPIGWEYVRAHYATHGWKKNIDKLDDAQKQSLADLLETANSMTGR